MIKNYLKKKKASIPKDRKIKRSSSSSFFYIGMALIFMLLAFTGFWSSYFQAILPGREIQPLTVPWLIHIHAAVSIGWLFLLLIETVFILRRKFLLHMKIGRYGLFLGAAVFLSGLMVRYLGNLRVFSRFGNEYSDSTILIGLLTSPLNIGIYLQLVNFAVFLILGYRMRRKPEYHKRYMLFATLAIMPAPVDRLFFLGEWRHIIFAILIVIIMLHDYITLRYIHKATLIGSLLIAICVGLVWWNGAPLIWPD